MEAPDVAEAPPPPSLLRGLQHLVLQHLREIGYKETAHSLERETGLYLDAEHLQDLVRRGAWDEAERYLGGFTGVGEDPCAAKVVFALRKQKYLEALDRRITAEEGEVLMNDLKALAPYDEEVAKMVAMLENFRQREHLDTASARDALALEIKQLIEANPLLQDKLEFPSFADSRLRTLVNQSLNMQHALCKEKKNPEVKTLFSDHSCDSDITLCIEAEKTTDSARTPKKITKSAWKAKQVTKSSLKPKQITKPEGLAPPRARPFQPVITPSPNAVADCLTNTTPSLPHAVVAEGTPSLSQLPSTGYTDTIVPSIDYAVERLYSGQLDEPPIVILRKMQPPIVDATLSLSCLSTPDVKPKDESEKIVFWNSHGGRLQLMYLPDEATPCRKVVSLLYANNGISLLALSSDATHKLWKWQCSDTNPNKKSITSVPQLWQPENGIVMKNDTSYGNTEEATACIALSGSGSYVVSASGGKVSVFNMMTFQVVSTFMAPPPAVTFILFHPQYSNIIAFGMEDSTIQIYNFHVGQVTNKLESHNKKITGLSFSQLKNVLVSSGADTQLCVWSIDVWTKKFSRYMVQDPNQTVALDGDTTWSPRNEHHPRISSAVYSCDGCLVYAGFCDGTIKIFESDLKFRVRVQPSDYVKPISSDGSVYPMVIAAHPSEPNQIALGMSNGTVIVLNSKLTNMDEQLETSPPQYTSAMRAPAEPDKSGMCRLYGVNFVT
ncbi:hypothetical protein EJB05_09363 [Eragrostis curvula]|uniref:LisH domain-containing protein n=1 Tax=Eragrostis curvula TaxID=38414 RepID=A0A5J9W494_9POAL|nr:hypothetical protein EJB05_09363 [Eragrostis curvula]